MRNLFRSTNMHNTIQVNEEEQNDIHETLLFSLPEQTFAKCSLFTKQHFIGTHRGFSDLIHERDIKLQENKIWIKDSFFDKQTTSGKICEYTSNFVLDDDVTIDIMKTGCRLNKKGLQLYVEVLHGELFVEDCMISKSYGTKVKSKKLVIKGKIKIHHVT